jgi:hypothetical protein
LVTSTIVDAGGGALKYSRRYRKTIGGTEVVSFHNSPRTRCNGVTGHFCAYRRVYRNDGAPLNQECAALHRPCTSIGGDSRPCNALTALLAPR